MLPEAAPSLDIEQHVVLSQITSDPPPFSFVTGPAGTGKSTLLRALKEAAGANAAVIAPTGLAALNVRGQTIHSFFSVRPGPLEPGNHEVPVFRPFAPKGRIMRALRLLIIDEISMVRADLMDAIDAILRANKNPSRPFGGVPIVAFGDLRQLEPVVENGPEQEMLAHYYASPFFFDCRALRDLPISVHNLTQVHRQADPEFIWALSRLRLADPEPIEYINERVTENAPEGAIRLCTTNRTADTVNLSRLAQLPGVPNTYGAALTGEFNAPFPGDQNLQLKVGAQVMITRNSDVALNGQIGQIVELGPNNILVRLGDENVVIEASTWEKIRYGWDRTAGRLSEEVIGTFTQLPVRLGWAATIHKAQGQTLDSAHVDFERGTFSHGQAYVGLSRVRSYPGLTLHRPLKPEDLIVDPRIPEWESAAGLA